MPPTRPIFSRLRGGLRIGRDFFARRRALGSGPPPRGLADRLADLGNPGIDVAKIHPAVVPFFDDPGSLALRIRSRWRFPFSIGWWLARPFARWVGQLVLPRSRAEIVVEMLALDPQVDGRADARGVIRSYADGSVMQVVAYATHARGEARYMHATFPVPGGHLAGVLRMDALGEDPSGLSVELTSRARDGDDAAIWIVHPLGAVRAPLGESLRLWPAGSPLAPPDLDAEAIAGATLVGRHEQRLFGMLLVAHDYGFRPR